jgi:ATPase subunit of ABC transporter with duplicated ATPase domains
VPAELKGGRMEEAMGVLERFKQSDELNEQYRKRLEAQSRKATAEAAYEAALKDLAAEQKAREAAEARESRLREMMRKAGIDPDAK